MRSRGVSVRIAALAPGLALAGALTLYGQERERVNPVPPTPAPRPTVSKRFVGKNIVRPAVTKFVDRTKPSITVVAESNAVVSLEPVNGGSVLQGQVQQGEKSVIFQQGLRPGRYLVLAELDGYIISEEEISITAAKPYKVDLLVTPITYGVTIQTNITSGEVRFRAVGAADMSYDTVRIQGRTVQLTRLRPGTYELEITPEEKSYKTLRTTLEVAGHRTVELNLEKDASSETFSWSSMSDWTAPAGWSGVPGLLRVGGAGTALPADNKYRNYVDFQVISEIKMADGVQASFVLRKRDDRNYYLVQVTGRNGNEPYVLRGYVIRDGVATRLGSAIPVDGYAKTLEQGRFFTAKLTMKDNRIKVEVQDTETGEELPLGILTDPNRTFDKGAVGLASFNGERWEVGRFVICPAQCP